MRLWPRRKAVNESEQNRGRRADDRRKVERRVVARRQADRGTTPSWDEQRAQFITRYLFAALGFAYFNLNASVARGPAYLAAIDIIHLIYIALTTVFLWHARRRVSSPGRMRLAMATDLLGVSAAAFVDANPMSPAYLVYVVIILGNGMRYGLGAFAESAVGSFACAAAVIVLRIEDYLRNVSVTTLFFILFLGIIVLYAYALMANIERARRNLELESSNDALTGLLNRRGLRERAETLFAALAPGKTSAAVLFADLDGFKRVNDVYGHDAGDRLLREVGRAIAAQVRDGDIIARFGGDEFVAIMPDATLEHAAIVAKRMQHVVAAVRDGGAELRLTIGIGLAPDHGSDFDAVLKAVDAAMYRGKLAGGGIRRADDVAVA